MSSGTDNPYLHPAAGFAPMSPYDEKQMALLLHILAIIFGVIPALIFFLIYRHRGPFIRAHAVAEWNFQLTVTIISMVVMVVMLASFGGIVADVLPGGSGASVQPDFAIFLPFLIGYFLIVVLRIVSLIFGIKAAVRAHRGLLYRFPGAFGFVRDKQA